MENIIQQNWNFYLDKEAKKQRMNITKELKGFLTKFGIEIDNPEEIIYLDSNC